MWAQIVSTALGVWLMVAPQLLGYGGAARTNDYVVGPVVATFACAAIWEATRLLRWLNVILALWLIAAPWLLRAEWTATINGTVTGLLVAGLALVEGELRHRLGGGWLALWRPERGPEQQGASV